MKSKQVNNKNEAVISISKLYKSFDDNHVLQGIDLELYKGENIVVLGRSGSGKSVLIKIIAGLMKPDKGVVKVFGKEVHKLDKKELIELRLKIGFLFQHSALYDSMTVRENLEFPLIRHERNISQEKINKAIEDVLDAVGLAETADQLPAELSGGQEKRIAIARTLILKPEIILYDEPTAGLDPLTSVEINNLVKEVKERYKTSSIIITHDLACAKTTGDRIFMLVDGKFIRQGDFEEVFDTDDERIKGFYDYNFIE
ncbi:MAG TPA: ATP-binding cassette domain-containing protein [Chitinophagaceae bacterium]|jgi:phospholipid/cholesterol/gamma-HCH transport system ATP-binding protein|nr:ATP-binding cassette domain-containing protein [Chitinophagaceae bacterium]